MFFNLTPLKQTAFLTASVSWVWSLDWHRLACHIINGPLRVAVEKMSALPTGSHRHNKACARYWFYEFLQRFIDRNGVETNKDATPLTNPELLRCFSSSDHMMHFVFAHKTQSPLSVAFTANNWDTRARASRLHCKWKWELGEWLAGIAS